MSVPQFAKSAMVATFAAAVLFTSVGAGSATARLVSPYQANVVNVSINFNSQSPLTETSEKAISMLQKMGRKMIYRMAREECETLRSTIAKTCSLTSLNVSSQVRQQHNRPNSLHINGSAQFAITLKPEEVD